MSLDPRFAILFEPVKIGPKTAPNRFYQVPHCTGMGYLSPATLATMRGIKAEGGWGVVNTEYCSIHPTSDDIPAPFCSLWDDGDVKNMALMVENVQGHGALAGVELWYGGQRSPNHHSRRVGLAPNSMPVTAAPWQCQRMDLADIKQYREWHKAAVRRALQAGFDIVYVYAAHTYLLAQFLDPRVNQRKDAYGGVLENRSRLYLEVLQDTRELVDGKAALATRVEVTDEDGSGKDERSILLSRVASYVDLFDVTVPDYGHEMGASRFIKEASLESEIAHVRALTKKPVVSVGRFTSPETMLSQVKRGIIDLIGAARPSIADPFIPQKIKEGRFDDIRECIGCNICYANDYLGVPIRCTQNPTMGEEWRRGWHPEKVNVATRKDQVLIVGSGPAGLEAAVTLGRRGVPVMLAEARNELGGRVTLEAKLPRLSEWVRVRDWRVQQIQKLSTVEVFRGSAMTAEDVLATGARHVMLATGADWRRNGLGRMSPVPIASYDDARTLTPDDIMAGKRPKGPVVIFDDDYYYMATSIAELLAKEGHDVTFVSSEGVVAPFTGYTFEQARIQAALIEAGVKVIVSKSVSGLVKGGVELSCVYSGRTEELACEGFVAVTSREPATALWDELREALGLTVERIGDCKAPGIIAQAVYDGHRAARAFGEPEVAEKRERVLALAL
ncbi:MAG: FAD-dependent oxidoreductase [Proteobacteria bacterium]|nr:FAD-dependent oxidoreductase [Pseudomonadota bacterium]